MPVIVPPPFGSLGNPYKTTAVFFDGTQDRLKADAVGSNFMSDSTIVTFGGWFRSHSDGGTGETLVQQGNNTFLITKTGTSNDVIAVAINGPISSIGLLSSASSTITLKVADDWVWIGLSFDSSNPDACWICKNDEIQQINSSGSSQLISFHTGTNAESGFAIAARTNSTAVAKMDTDVADIWYAPEQLLNFSSVSNRRKFVDANGKPVFLGANGQRPTGSQPYLFLKGNASSFPINKGSIPITLDTSTLVGNGTIEDSTTSPSD